MNFFKKLSIYIVLLLITIHSSFGNETTNDSAQPHRLVSLTPSITKTIADLGMSKHLVGLTSYCQVPKDASHATVIGTSVSPNIEAIVAQKPTLVIGDIEYNREPILQKLESVGISVVRVGPHHDLESITQTLKTIGQALGIAKHAQQMIDHNMTRLQEIKLYLNDKTPIPVFVEIWPKPLKTISGGDFVNSIIEQAGGDNIFADSSISYPTVSMESVITKKPKKIIILTHSLVDEERIEQYHQFPSLKNSPVQQFDSAAITQPNLINFVDGVELIAQWLHGVSDE